MTQVEFENQLRELRCQKGAAVSAVALMQSEVKEEISAIDRQIQDLRARREKLNQQRLAYGSRRIELEREHGERIRNFFKENFTESRELENVSEWALVKELRKRDYTGSLENNEKGDDFLKTLNLNLNGTSGETDENDTDIAC